MAFLDQLGPGPGASFVSRRSRMQHDLRARPAAEAAPGHTTRDRHAETAGLFCLGTGLFFGWSALFYIFGALLLTWEAQTGLSKAQLALGLTAATLASALAAPLAGRVIDRGAGSQLLGVGALIGAAGLGGLSLTTGHAGFMIAWIVIGIAQGTCLFEPSFSFLARVMQHRARRSIALVGLIAGCATIPAYSGAALLTELYGWRSAVGGFALLTACVTAPLMYAGARLLEPGRPPSRTRPQTAGDHDALARVRRRPAFWGLLGAFAALAFAEGLVLSHAVAAMVEFGQSQAIALIAMALLGPCMTTARAGLLYPRSIRSSLPLTILAALAMVIGTALLPAAGDSAFALLAVAAFGLGYGLVVVLKPILVAECLGFEAIGAVLAAVAQPCFVALALAPYAGALLWEHGGYALAIPVAAGVAGCGALTLLVMAIAPRTRAPSWS